MDLTEECGTSVQEQWRIRQEVRERFPHKPWVDVFSKQDVIGDLLVDGLELRAQQEARRETETDTFKVDRGHDEGITGAKKGMNMSMQGHKRGQLVIGYRDDDDDDDEGTVCEALGPEEVVALLPGALAVSSHTESGIPELKDQLMALLEEHYRNTEKEEGWTASPEDEERVIGSSDPLL
jgi:hypothetical protein